MELYLLGFGEFVERILWIHRSARKVELVANRRSRSLCIDDRNSVILDKKIDCIFHIYDLVFTLLKYILGKVVDTPIDTLGDYCFRL